MPSFDPLTVLYFVVALLPAIVIHEWSHGVAADRMGDHTPRMAGRLTLNPGKHIDPFGTIILPALLLLPRLFGQAALPVFGYAKPMPITTGNLKEPNRQMMWIAAVGPLSNLLLAVVGALALRFAGGPGVGILADFLLIFVFVNVLLAVFNLLPIPPLDGSKVLARFLPGRAGEIYRSWEPYGALFILVMFFIFPGPVFSFVGGIVDGILGVLLG